MGGTMGGTMGWHEVWYLPVPVLVRNVVGVSPPEPHVLHEVAHPAVPSELGVQPFEPEREPAFWVERVGLLRAALVPAVHTGSVVRILAIPADVHRSWHRSTSTTSASSQHWALRRSWRTPPPPGGSAPPRRGGRGCKHWQEADNSRGGWPRLLLVVSNVL